MAVVSFPESELRRDIEARHPEVTAELRAFEESKLGTVIRYGGAPSPRVTDISGRAIAQQDEARKKADALRIEKERQKAVFDARQKYQSEIRGVTNKQQRLDRLNEFLQEQARANAIARTERVSAGIIIGAVVRTTTGEIKVTPETAVDIRERLIGEEVVRVTEEAPVITLEPKKYTTWDIISGKWFEREKVYPLAMRTKYKGEELTYEEWKAREEVGTRAYEERLEKGMPLLKAFPFVGEKIVSGTETIFGKEISEPYRKETVGLISDIYKLVFLGKFLGEMKAVKGKKGVKVKLKSVKKTDKKTVEKIANKLEEIIKTSRTKQEAERSLARAMKTYKDSATALNVDKEIIDMNLKGMMEFSQNRGFFIDVAKPVIKPPEEIISFVGAPPTEVPVPEITVPAYAGLGLYERTWTPEEQFLKARDVLKVSPEIKLATGIFEKLKPEQNILAWTKPAVKEKMKLDISPRVAVTTALALRLTTEQRTRLAQQLRERLAQKERLVQKEKLGLKQTLALKTISAQIEKLKYRLRYREGLKVKPRIPKPRIPKRKIPFFFFLGLEEPAKKKVLISALKKIAKFKVWERRYGKWRGIGEKPTLREAKLLGMGRTATTLGASFKVTRAGKPVRLTELGGMFRPAKREPLVYVQKAKFRLAHPKEVKEIMFAKKKKGSRKVKWL